MSRLRRSSMPVDLHNTAVWPSELTDQRRPLSGRQREVAALIQKYYAGANELPSYGWLARQLDVTRQTAREYVEALKTKGWCAPHR